MRALLLFAMLLSIALPLHSQRVILTGIVDGDATGGLPKAIELYVEGTVDLGNYTIVRYANGGTSGTPLSLSGVYSDRFVYLTNNATALAETFGTAGDFADPIVSGTISGNGNDQFELQLAGTPIDLIGGSLGDASNVYQDGFLYRTDNTGPTPVFDLNKWTGGNGLLDGLSYAEMGAAIPFGTYSAGAAGPTVTVTSGANLAEPAGNGGFLITLSEPADAAVNVTYTLSGTAELGTDYTDPNGGSVTLTAGTTDFSVDLIVIDDAEIEGEETIELTLVSVSDATYRATGSAAIVVADDDLAGTVLISTVQGPGFTTPLLGETVTVEAVVTGVFNDGGNGGLRGFYLQEEEADSDGNPTTSEGIFVFSDNADVSVGDLLKLSGQAAEFSGQTQLGGVTYELLATGLPLPTAVSLSLPLADSSLEALEGMRVAPVDLIVTETFDLARFGEITVTSGERLIQFTECNAPDAAAFAAYTAAQENDRILIDDGRNGSNLTPILLPDGTELTASNTLRSGQTIENLTGILGYGFNQYRIQPTETEAVTFGGNVRPEGPPEVGGEIRVISANVLNYFTTLNQRGADNAEEFERQQAKIVSALCALRGDIVGLVEIENNDYVALEALIAAIAERCGVDYGYVVSPNTGSDQIMVALIYRPDRVEESGFAAALDTPASVFIGPGTNRVPLAQTFRVIDPTSKNYGQELTVAINHFKSKGSGCNDDAGDGAGNCNAIRDAAARELTAWLATYPTGVEEEDILILGDLNAYRMEDPIQTILAAGYFNTKVAVADPASFPCGGGAASYGFMGQWGSLDYALASNSLSDALTGAAAWDVNAAEPTAVDYNLEGPGGDVFAPDYFRFSDHNPIVVGLDLGPALSEDVVNLTGRALGRKVQLTWKTVSDITASYFAIERLTADGTFTTIGTVRVSGGNSNGNRKYVFNDQTAPSGANTYRLRVVEADGTARYSEEVSVALLGKSLAAVAQATGPGVYRIATYTEATTFTLVSLSGQVLQRGQLANTGGEVNAAALPAGMYLLYLTDAEVAREPVKILVP